MLKKDFKYFDKFTKIYLNLFCSTWLNNYVSNFIWDNSINLVITRKVYDVVKKLVTTKNHNFVSTN